MNRRRFLCVLASSGMAANRLQKLLAAKSGAAAGNAGGISLNYDNSHFFCWHPTSEMTEAGVDAWVDQFAGTQVDYLLFCPNSQRSSVASSVRQTIWDGYDPKGGFDQPFLAGIPDTKRWPRLPSERRHFLNWANNAWLLHHRGIDPYARWIARCRQHAIRPWLSMRMNDIHFVENPNHSIHDRFWKEHPQFRRDPKGDRYNGQCLDYAHAEVRAYQMAYVRELVFRYDIDGFELDWMRNPYNFKPGRERDGMPILTDFIVEIRRLLDRRENELHHRILLAARVPDRPETARALGFDVETWARRNLLDRLVVSPFLFSQFDIPLEDWKRSLGESTTGLDAGLMLSIQPTAGGNYSTGAWRGKKGLTTSHSMETARGAAASFYSRGADRIYLFNFFDDMPYGAQGAAYRNSPPAKAFHRLQCELGNPTTIRHKSRRLIVTNDDTTAPRSGRGLLLPREVAVGGEAEFLIPTGPAPDDGQTVLVRIAPDPPKSAEAEAWEIRVNGTVCRPLGRIGPPPQGGGPTHAFEVPISAVRPFNRVRISNSGDAALRLVWVEIVFSGPGPAAAIEAAPLDFE